MYGCMGSAVGMVRTILIRASSVNANASKVCVRQKPRHRVKTLCHIPHSNSFFLLFCRR